MIFVFGSFPFSVLSLVYVLLKLLYVSVSRGRLCYRTELFYFNYLSLLGLEHIYISYFLQQPKKKRLPAASAHFTLFFAVLENHFFTFLHGC